MDKIYCLISELLTLHTSWRIQICANARGWGPEMREKPTVQGLTPRKARPLSRATTSASTANIATTNLGSGSN